MNTTVHTVHLTEVQDYQFDIDFGGATRRLRVDEPPPLGQGAGPSPVPLLASAVGSCLASSLLFALRKYKLDPGTLRCEVQADVGRNAEGRLRVLAMRVKLQLGVAAAGLQHLDRVLASFEDFCTVTQSVRASIPVQVGVADGDGVQLK